MSPDPIMQCLLRSRELVAFCTQDGWIDNDTLRYEILERAGEQSVLAVEFEEIIMEGSGCVVDRKACYGRLRIWQAADGTVTRVQSV